MKKAIRFTSAVIGLCMMFNTNSTLSFADSYNSDQKNSAVNSEEEYILEK